MIKVGQVYVPGEPGVGDGNGEHGAGEGNGEHGAGERREMVNMVLGRGGKW